MCTSLMPPLLPLSNVQPTQQPKGPTRRGQDISGCSRDSSQQETCLVPNSPNVNSKGQSYPEEAASNWRPARCPVPWQLPVREHAFPCLMTPSFAANATRHHLFIRGRSLSQREPFSLPICGGLEQLYNFFCSDVIEVRQHCWCKKKGSALDLSS